ncbi:hypothetical protein [Chthonobacter albigriseus]|uniref:hypothetical protein n=1 Tax=Chthonobacter albigriseus TaxID=1683161 RepID=UPI0015EE71AB|nr:hypothetical protein [Chthonobacter albigriseus]
MARKPGGPTAELPLPSASEQAEIRTAEERHHARRKPVQARTAPKDASLALGPTYNNLEGFSARLLDALGSASQAFVDAELLRLTYVLKSDVLGFETRLNAALAFIEAVRPVNEVEAVLAVQAAATHAVSMSKLSTLVSVSTITQAESAANIATKLQRTLLSQMETLNRLRRGGQQNVRVEHVHVHAGGQAIVGAVSHDGGGAGVEPEKQEQGHAIQTRSIAHAPSAPLWGKDPLGLAVPVASGP